MFNPWKSDALRRRRDPRTPFDLALAALERGEAEDAYRRLCDLLAQETPVVNRAALHNKRGVALVMMDRKAEALGDFRAALELQPAFSAALVNLGNMYLEEGDIEEAILQYLAAVRADDTYALAHFNLGAAYKKLGRHAEAVREWRTATRLEGRALTRRR